MNIISHNFIKLFKNKKNSNKKEIYAITGGCGLLGQHLIHLLLNEFNQNQQIRVIDKINSEKIKCIYPADFADSKIKFFLGVDISDNTQLEKILEDVDVVFHLAATILYGKMNKLTLQASNVIGTQNILAAAQKTKVKKFIYVSSYATLGCLDNENQYANETSTNNWEKDKACYYGFSKYQAEQLAQSALNSTMQVSIAIPGVMFGPGPAHHASILPFLTALKRKWTIAPEGGMGIVDVRDAAKGIILMLKNNKNSKNPEKYLIVSHNITHKDLLKRIAHLGNKPIKILVIPKWTSPFLAKLGDFLEWFLPKQSFYSKEGISKAFQYRYFNNLKIRSELGWKPHYTLDETIRDTITYSGLQKTEKHD